MNKCGRCVFWGLRSDGGYDSGDFRQCGRIPFDDYGEAHKTDAEAADDAEYWEEAVRPIRVELAVVTGDVASFRTRASFGCILWENK